MAAAQNWFTSIWQWISHWSKRYPWIYPIIAILLVYHALPMTYFEQDEWQAFETYINTGHRPITDCLTIQRPLTCVINTAEWQVFGTHASAYGFFSLLLIILVSLAFYRLLRKFELPQYKAVLAASLFPLFVTGSQAITWFGAFSATLPSFLFAILSVDFLIESIRRQSRAWQVASIVAMLASLYFKEESLWLIPVLMVTAWAFGYLKEKSKSDRLKSFGRYLWPIIVTILIFLFIERTRQLHNDAFTSLISTTNSSQYLSDVMKSLYLLPFQHLSHILIGPELIIAFSTYFGLTTIQLSTIASCVLLVFFAWLLVFKRPAYQASLFVLVVWAISGFVAYAIFGKNPDFLEGRYYFAVQAPVVTLLVLGLLPDRAPRLAAFNTAAAALLALIVFLNISLAQQRMTHSLDIASERKDILSFIQRRTGPLPKKAIIFTETSNYGYVGQAAAIMPFQNGLGTTLRVLYQGKGQDYRAVSKRQGYLWNLLNQGYDEVDGVGFGYFREYDRMVEAYKVNHLEPNDVFAFRYQGRDITDVTSIIRGRLVLMDKKLVPIAHDGWSLKSSNDHGVDERHGIEKVLDPDPKSDWAVPHQRGAFLEADLGKPVDNVAEITLTTADGNSFPRIFSFEYSPDGEHWIDDFTDIGTIVDTDKTPILFGPKTIRKFRIKITDARPTIFAWSVSDLNVATAQPLDKPQ